MKRTFYSGSFFLDSCQLSGIRVRDAINSRRSSYEEETKQELDDTLWEKMVKEAEKHYTKDCKTELER